MSAPPSTERSAPIHYETFQLSNGLTGYVIEDRQAPRAAVNLLYQVGARDEHPHRTGMAHLFEHLMFGGSQNAPQYDVPVQRAGGENNAFTNSDITNYYLVLPPSQLETAFWLESDRMHLLDLTPKALDVQKSVVMEEFKQRYLNQPYGDAYLHMRPLKFQQHPYRWMTIGEKLEHIEAVTRPEALAFYDSFYAPNNAILTVAGDVKASHVEQLAEKWFGQLPAREVRRPERPAEPQQTQARSREISGPVPQTAVYRAYPCPARSDAHYPVVDLLTDLLSNGQAGRLYQHLVKERKLASQANAFTWGLYDPGMLSVDARLAEGVEPETYQAALADTLASLQEVPNDELLRIQNKIEAQEVFQRTRVTHRALALAIFASLGHPEWINTIVDQYRAVTPAQVEAAAAQWLQPEQSATLVYRPEAAS